MTHESLWHKSRNYAATGAALLLLGSSVFAPASAVQTSGELPTQISIQTVNEATDAQVKAESIVMKTVFSNDASVTSTIKYKVSNADAETVKNIIEPRNGVGTMETSTEGDSTVYTVTIKGTNPQDFQQKFVKSDATPNGYMPGAKFEFVIGEGFGLWPQYVFLLDAPFTSNWFKDGVTGEYTSTFDLPWLNDFDENYKNSSTGQRYLEPSGAQIEGQTLKISDPDGVAPDDAKTPEHLQFVAAGPQRSQLFVMAAILLAVLLLIAGIIWGLKKRKKKPVESSSEEKSQEASAADEPAPITYPYSSNQDSQPATQPQKIVPLADDAPEVAAIRAASAHEIPADDDETPRTVATDETEVSEATSVLAVNEIPDGASIGAIDESRDEESLATEEPVSVEPVAESAVVAELPGDASIGAVDEPVEESIEALPAENETPQTVVSETNPYYDYEAQQWKNTDGWAWNSSEWMKSTEPYYDFEAKAWKNTDGWAWDGDEWVKKPYYNYEAAHWQGTEGWQWDGADWCREPHYNYEEGAWKGTEGWEWTGESWRRA